MLHTLARPAERRRAIGAAPSALRPMLPAAAARRSSSINPKTRAASRNDCRYHPSNPHDGSRSTSSCNPGRASVDTGNRSTPGGGLRFGNDIDRSGGQPGRADRHEGAQGRVKVVVGSSRPRCTGPPRGQGREKDREPPSALAAPTTRLRCRGGRVVCHGGCCRTHSRSSARALYQTECLCCCPRNPATHPPALNSRPPISRRG